MIATTTWWPQAARLAVELANSGAEIGAICPRGSPLAMVSGVRDIFSYAAIRPRRSLVAALRAMRPDLVVPCDERTVGHLHALYRHASRVAGADSGYLTALIERSLGAPAGYDITLDRGAVLALAGQAGIRVPISRVLRSEAEVRLWCAERPLPTLLKADGSWGGAGVALVDNSGSAVAAFRRMSRPIATWRAAKFVLCNRDPFPLASWIRRERSGVIGQEFIRGYQANIMVACWEGEVLATVAAKVLVTAKRFGAATIIQLVAQDEMDSAARRLARRLGLSGFHGFDFVIEDETGDAYLIEMNPRATQLGHLRLGAGYSLAAALLAGLRGDVITAPSPVADRTVALFPQAWVSGDAAPLLASAHHDVPWEEHALVAELLRRPWESRGPLARVIDRVRRRPDPEILLAAAFGNGKASDSHMFRLPP
jgi:hypothetical protein